MFQHLIDIVWPPQCGGCGALVQNSHSLCASCWSQVHQISGVVCNVCGVKMSADVCGVDQVTCGRCYGRPPSYTQARAVSEYSGCMRSLILSYKHADRLDLVPLLSQMTMRVVRNMMWDIDLLVSVPLHWRRLWQRKFNQSDKIARFMAHHLHIEYAPKLLTRYVNSPSQRGKRYAERHKNVRGAFIVCEKNKIDIKGKRVLLVDDVITTGATVDTISQVLLKGGVKDVFVVTLARVSP